MNARRQRLRLLGGHFERPCQRRVCPAVEALEDRLTPSMDPLVQPPVIHSVNGVLKATLTEGIGPAMVGDTAVTNAWTYNGSYVGPTLMANPGDLLDLTIVNHLAEPTNLHTHGLHVSPLGNSDDILLHIEPGGSNEYKIQIPADQPEGLYWYHPHEHGFVDDQISLGLSGLLVIGRPDGGAPQLDGLTQQLLALKNARLVGNQITVPAMDGSDHNAQTFTVNGQLNPVITMRPNEWQVFNVADIGNDAFYFLFLVDSLNPNDPNPPELLAVAADGEEFTKVGNPQLMEPQILAFPPGRRWSFLVHAPANPAPGQQFLLQTGGFIGLLPEGTPDPTNQWPPATLLTIQFAGPPVIGGPTFVHGSPLSPPNNVFHDLRLVPESQIAAHRTVVFGENGQLETINGQPFPNGALFQPRLNTVEEWILVNPTGEDHPFHLHTNPQQVVSGPVNPNKGGLPLFTDIENVPAGKTVVIRIEFTDFLGEMVYHCHRVDHEDDGMMALVKILPTQPVYAIGANAGQAPRVKVTDPVTGAVVGNFLAFTRGYRGGVRTAVADVNGDGVYDIIVGRAKGLSQVKVIDGTKLNQVDPKTGVILPSALLGNFLSYQQGFMGGVFVAAGDVNGDGLADVITGPGIGRRSNVKVIDATKLNQGSPTTTIKPGALLANILAFQQGFLGGVRVASGDLNGDGRTDVVTGQGPGGLSRVKVFGGPHLMVTAAFRPFGPDFGGGVFVGTGNVKGFAFDDILIGQGPGSRPRVKVFSNQTSVMMHSEQLKLAQVDSFLAYRQAFDGGVQVTSLHDSTPLPVFGGNRDDVVTAHATGAASAVRIFPRTIPVP
jgi:suppressor of ftsI